MSAWTCRHTDGKVVQKIVPPRPRIPYWKGLGADSEEKHEPASDIDTALVDSLKVLDPEGPIREADIADVPADFPKWPGPYIRSFPIPARRPMLTEPPSRKATFRRIVEPIMARGRPAYCSTYLNSMRP
jgi:hypothetical protein